MSQIEQQFRQFLSQRPEIEKCYQAKLINRRSLARYLIRHGIAKSNQLEAVVAMLRRFPFQKHEQGSLALFRQANVRIKDRITLFDFEKSKQLLQELKRVIDAVSYDKGETLKIVVGSSAIKLFMDEGGKDIISDLTKRFTLRNRYPNISEISMLFPEEAIETKGIISFISRELYLNDVLVLEMLTATPELLIYVKGDAVLKAYQVIKRLAGADV